MEIELRASCGQKKGLRGDWIAVGALEVLKEIAVLKLKVASPSYLKRYSV